MSEMKKLFLEELRDMYGAERLITQALPKWMEAATCEELKTALETHLQETEVQITKLERVFEAFGEKPQATNCPAMAGILEEGDQVIAQNKESAVINAAIVAAAQKIEHYEIATYGCLEAWAGILENRDAEDILGEINNEEKKADRTLNELSAVKNEEALEEVRPGELATN